MSAPSRVPRSGGGSRSLTRNFPGSLSTEAGLKRLGGAYPVHLASVRSRIMNHVEPKALACLGDVMATIVRGIDEAVNAD